jgi:hypothetical protein
LLSVTESNSANTSRIIEPKQLRMTL